MTRTSTVIRAMAGSMGCREAGKWGTGREAPGSKTSRSTRRTATGARTMATRWSRVLRERSRWAPTSVVAMAATPSWTQAESDSRSAPRGGPGPAGGHRRATDPSVPVHHGLPPVGPAGRRSAVPPSSRLESCRLRPSAPLSTADRRRATARQRDIPVAVTCPTMTDRSRVSLQRSTERVQVAGAE